MPCCTRVCSHDMRDTVQAQSYEAFICQAQSYVTRHAGPFFPMVAARAAGMSRVPQESKLYERLSPTVRWYGKHTIFLPPWPLESSGLHFDSFALTWKPPRAPDTRPLRDVFSSACTNSDALPKCLSSSSRAGFLPAAPTCAQDAPSLADSVPNGVSAMDQVWRAAAPVAGWK